MSEFFDCLTQQYACSPTLEIILELIAATFGVISVLFSRANKIMVYPTGIISTGIYVYLLISWGLLGDMLVNVYYFVMSIFGWYFWAKKTEGKETPITITTKKDQFYALILFASSIVFVTFLYLIFDKLNPESNSCNPCWDFSLFLPFTPYIDVFSTAIFFVGMWLMAKRKIAHWYFWIIGNCFSIPLYFIKGFPITSLQYVIFLAIAILGYCTWKKKIKTNNNLSSHA